MTTRLGVTALSALKKILFIKNRKNLYAGIVLQLCFFLIYPVFIYM